VAIFVNTCFTDQVALTISFCEMWQRQRTISHLLIHNAVRFWRLCTLFDDFAHFCDQLKLTQSQLWITYLFVGTPNRSDWLFDILLLPV